MTTRCPWPVPEPTCNAYARLSEEMRARIMAMATEFLDRWTGRQFGVCSVDLRPCPQGCAGRRPTTYEGRGPVVPDASLSGCCSGTCEDPTGPYAVRIPGPVVSVEEVLVDGEVVDPSEYRVDRVGNAFFLIRPGAYWPTTQDWDAPEDGVGAFTIRYSQGVPVPEGGLMAAATLACELALALTNDSSCGLPQRIQSITRQGVTVAVMDSFDDIDKGHTGIWVIDSWVASVMKTPARSRVLSPDSLRSRRGTSRSTVWRGQ